LPEGVTFTENSNPYDDFECTVQGSGGVVNYNTYSPPSDGYGVEDLDGVPHSYIKFKANIQVDGDIDNYYILKFGGVKNPIST